MTNTEIKWYVEDYAGEFVNYLDIEDIDLDSILQAHDILEG